jgi:hypothetical protein
MNTPGVLQAALKPAPKHNVESNRKPFPFTPKQQVICDNPLTSKAQRILLW